MKSLLIAAAFFLLSQIAFAKPLELVSCSDAGATLESMLLGADNQKSYYSGNVGLITYFTQEPAAAPFGIAIVYTEPVEMEGYVSRKCLAIPYLSGVDLKDSKALYNATTGLTVTVPVRKMDGFTGLERNTVIQINIKTVNTGRMNEGHIVTAEEI